ncbi:MAG: tetratricopeptide repeat protein, partial [Proteobacteria bacterium]|nr:tetratricopeptide repeat protein [Pseudomonadota bacterium]
KLEASATPLPPAATPPRGPTAEDMAAAQQMSAEGRTEMIRGMVEGLAARLEESPDDLEGWQRLGRAYGVLGETDKAINAYDQVERLDPGNAVAKQALQNLRAQ